jgi:hypothetical protein
VQRSKEKERPGSDAWPFCIFLRLIAVALLNLPQAVITATSVHGSDWLSARAFQQWRERLGRGGKSKKPSATPGR